MKKTNKLLSKNKLNYSFYCSDCKQYFSKPNEVKNTVAQSLRVEVGEDEEGYAILEDRDVEVVRTQYFCPICNSKYIQEDVCGVWLNCTDTYENK